MSTVEVPNSNQPLLEAGEQTVVLMKGVVIMFLAATSTDVLYLVAMEN